MTRGLSAGAQDDPAAKAKETNFVDTLRNRQTRSLSLGEREEIAQIASTKPKIDLEIQLRLQLGRYQQDLGAGGAGTRQGAVAMRA